MPGSIVVGAVEFLSVKDAAERVSYSRDYVARLAREGKIVATQVGRQWFIDPVSLENFASSSEIEREIRSKQLREERRQERAVCAEQAAYVASLEQHDALRSPLAVLKTLSVVVCGLLLGVIINAGYSHQIKSVPGQGVTAQVSYAPTGNRYSAPEKQQANTDAMEVYRSESFVRRLPAGHGVLLLPEVASTTHATAVVDLFSDNVSVTYETDSVGVITPVYRDGAGTAVPFVTVPVRSGTVATHNSQAVYE